MSSETDFEQAREEMVDRLQRQLTIEREETAEAMRAVPRHEFVPEDQRDRAYHDRPLPIGANQTISAPHIVAKMTELLVPEPGDEILEIGTGCGYHAAVTAEIVGDENVYSVEYVEKLAEEARDRLADIGYDINIRVGDGHEGWPEHALYDGAYLTCAVPEIPGPIIEQVRPGGTIVAPVGADGQRLVRARRHEDGELSCEEYDRVRFVPMQGDE